MAGEGVMERAFQTARRFLTRGYFLETDLAPDEALRRIKEAIDNRLYMVEPIWPAFQGEVKGNRFELYLGSRAFLGLGRHHLRMPIRSRCADRHYLEGRVKAYGAGSKLRVTGRLPFFRQLQCFVLVLIVGCLIFAILRDLLLGQLFDLKIGIFLFFGCIWELVSAWKTHNYHIETAFKMLQDIVPPSRSGRLW